NVGRVARVGGADQEGKSMLRDTTGHSVASQDVNPGGWVGGQRYDFEVPVGVGLHGTAQERAVGWRLGPARYAEQKSKHKKATSAHEGVFACRFRSPCHEPYQCNAPFGPTYTRACLGAAEFFATN